MDVTNEQIEVAVEFCQGLRENLVSISAEQPALEGCSREAARAYYHAVRFVRFYQILQRYNRVTWLMDVDALFNRTPDELFGRFAGHDVAFRVRPGRLEPWNRFSAELVGGATSRLSLEFFRLVTAYIMHFFRRGELRWGIDQLSMFGVYNHMEQQGSTPHVMLIAQHELDAEHLDNGLIWHSSAQDKYDHLFRDQIKLGSVVDKYQLKMGEYSSALIENPSHQRLLSLLDKSR